MRAVMLDKFQETLSLTQGLDAASSSVNDRKATLF